MAATTAPAEHELELAELVRLEAAGLLEPLAERLELERGHRLEDVELRDEHLQDGEDALERVLGAVRRRWRRAGARTRSSSCRISLNQSS